MFHSQGVEFSLPRYRSLLLAPLWFGALSGIIVAVRRDNGQRPAASGKINGRRNIPCPIPLV